MTHHAPTPDRTMDTTPDPGVDLRQRLDQALNVVDIPDCLDRIEAQIAAARAAIADEAEGPLTAAVNVLVVEAFLAHRVVSTW